MKVLKEDVTIRFKVTTHDYGELTVPKGTKITNQTAMGVDENYNFVDDFSWVGRDSDGNKQALLLHDLEHVGLNIPSKHVVLASELEEDVKPVSGEFGM